MKAKSHGQEGYAQSMTDETDLITVYRSADSDAGQEAKAIQELLMKGGFDARLFGDNATGVVEGAYEVRVPRAERESAEALIDEHGTEDRPVAVDPSHDLDLVTVAMTDGTTGEMEALAIQPGDHIVAIASGGCNILSYLTGDPARITGQNHPRVLRNHRARINRRSRRPTSAGSKREREPQQPRDRQIMVHGARCYGFRLCIQRQPRVVNRLTEQRASSKRERAGGAFLKKLPLLRRRVERVNAANDAEHLLQIARRQLLS